MQYPSFPSNPAGAPAREDRQPAGERCGEGAGSVLLPLHEDAGKRARPTPGPGEHPSAGHAAGDDAAPRTIGKYLVSPLIKRSGNGWFATSVSIRSGSGSGTSDRILRMTRLFRCAREAAAYAHSEALQWISAPGRAAAGA